LGDWASVKIPTQTSPFDTGRTAVAISAGRASTCAILDDGSVSCWGSNYYGQGGDGTSISKNTPTQTVPLGQVAVAISVGWRHTCALLDDDSVRCWGVNSEGQLGDGTNTGTIQLGNWPGTNYPIPTSELYCWGDNEILACNAAQLEKVKRFYNRHPNSQCLLDDMLLAKRRVPVVGDCSLSNEFLGCNDEQLKKIKRLYNLHPGKTCS
jgi:alpha-tubulin suppressor-like RCC1 family protein